MSNSIIPAHAVQFSNDTQLDAVSSYDRLTTTRRETAVRLHIPAKSIQVGERNYECTVTFDEYYGRDHD